MAWLRIFQVTELGCGISVVSNQDQEAGDDEHTRFPQMRLLVSAGGPYHDPSTARRLRCAVAPVGMTTHNRG